VVTRVVVSHSGSFSRPPRPPRTNWVRSESCRRCQALTGWRALGKFYTYHVRGGFGAKEWRATISAIFVVSATLVVISVVFAGSALRGNRVVVGPGIRSLATTPICSGIGLGTGDALPASPCHTGDRANSVSEATFTRASDGSLRALSGAFLASPA
jgi:hypothetical protein